MDNEIKKPKVRKFKSLTHDDFIVTLNKGLNSGRIKELGIVPLTTNSATVLTNSLKELYKKEVPKNYYGYVEYDFEWEINLNHE
jgi:hypothetical protein